METSVLSYVIVLKMMDYACLVWDHIDELIVYFHGIFGFNHGQY